MARRVIDQTDSEVRLHRPLYYSKYLRGLLLNAFVSVIAILLYVAFGIAGAYVLATDTINGLKAQMMSATALGMSGSQFIVQLVLTSLFIVAFFVWSYLSIVNVSKISLRIQAIFLMISVLSGPLWAGPQIRFAMAKLNPGFMALVFLGIVVGLYMIGDVTCAMWRTSRATENSSFKAMLDPRLARGTWSYINKLLDLPRTPWRNCRTVVSYFLGFGGALLLIGCVISIFSVGIIWNRLGQLYALCGDVMSEPCRVAAAQWTSQIPVWLGLSFVGLLVAAFMQSSAELLGGLTVPEALHGSSRFILYLRPFDPHLLCVPGRARPQVDRFRRRYLRARAGIAWPAFSNRSRVSLR